MKLKHIGLLVIGLILAILYFYVNPTSTSFFPRCPLYTSTGVYCPGCGSQRALHDFLHFDIMGVIGHNVLFLFGILILGYHVVILALNKFSNKRVNNLLYHKRTPLIILIIIIVYWILRNIPMYPFTLLAPNN